MSFLAPLMLVGLAGVAVPLVIHLIGRRRAPIRKFAAMDFLLGTNRRVARRLRLREVVLLVVRALACVVIPLALAKPFVSCAARGVTVERGPQAVVLVVDNSFTAGYRKGSETLFERAKDRVRRALEQLGPEADVAIEYTAEGEPAASELTRDHLRLRDALDAARLTARPAATTAALRRAAALLGTSPHAVRRIYLFSVLAASGFQAGEPPWPPGAGPEVRVVPLDDGDLPNLAVTGLAAEKDPDLGPRGVRVTVTVAGFGGQKVDGRPVTLRIDGRAVARGLVSLGPGESVQKRFSAQLPSDARTAEVVAELDGDNLPIDDRRYLRVELRRDVRVLLVDGDPRTVRHEDELFYLETALRPGDRADSSLEVATTTVDELPRRRLADYDVVFLCNVKPLEARRVAELEEWVKKGGGLLVALGDNVDPDAYNAQMAPLLAQELRTTHQFAGGPKAPDAGRAERLARLESRHPIFAVFSAEAPGLRAASFWKAVLLGPSERPAERSALARFGNGAPALVEARRGTGRLLLWTSTLDRDWNDLPIHPGYLPLVQQLARYLARAPTEEHDPSVVVGRERELPVTPDDERLDVTTPGGRKDSIEGVRLRGRTAIAFSDVVEPGFYHVTATRAGTERAVPAADFVANVDPRGSDTRRVGPAELPSGGGGVVAGSTEPPRRRVELWHALAAALLLFLLGEAILTWRG
jgi:hypothetical protein